MAIIKDFETPQGVNATYHKILKAEIDAVGGVVVVTTAIFKDAAAREDGKRPLWHEYTSIPFEAMTGDFRNSLYELLTNFFNSYIKGGESDVVPVEYPPVLTDPAYYEPPAPPVPEVPSEPETP